MNDWSSAGYDKSGGTPSSDSPTSNPVAAAVARIANYLNTSWPGYSSKLQVPLVRNKREQNKSHGIYTGWELPQRFRTPHRPKGLGRTQRIERHMALPKNMRWSSFLWDGSLGSGARILPQTRSPLIAKVGVGFHLAQQGTGTGLPHYTDTDPTTGKSIKNTTKYGVNATFAFEFHLPNGYQGFHSVSSGKGRGCIAQEHSNLRRSFLRQRLTVNELSSLNER